MRTLTTYVAVVLISPATVWGTFAGSVVSSFYGTINVGPITHYPVGITYGDGYLWVSYSYFITKRTVTGSIVATIYQENQAGPPLGWEESHKYLYGACWGAGVFWWDSSTGSLVGSFPRPPGSISLHGIDYNDRAPANPIWLCEWQGLPTRKLIWNLTTAGSIIASWNVINWPILTYKLAYDGETPGGPFLFVADCGPASSPAIIGKAYVNNCSLLSTFQAPIIGPAADITWDGNYLWGIQNPGAPTGWIYRFVAHEYPSVAPASFGKIKALFQ